MTDHWEPFAKPAARVRREPVPLWEFRKDHHTWSAHLVFHGESYGWEAQIEKDGDLVIGRRFVLRDEAAAWADEERTAIEKGWE